MSNKLTSETTPRKTVSTFDVPVGEKAIISGSLNRCSCGCLTINANFVGIATNEYNIVKSDGVLRRKFLVADGVPACKCYNEIWLSDNDGHCTHPLFSNVCTESLMAE